MPNVQTILPRIADRRILTYGFSPQADLSARRPRSPTGGGSRFGVRLRSDRLLGRRSASAADARPAQRAQRAGRGRRRAGAAHRLRRPSPAASPASRGCTAASSTSATWRGATVVDDYAHHPTEVDATLQAARADLPRGAGPRRLPAAPLLAHPGPGRGVRPLPAGRRHGRGHRRLPLARAADPRRHRRAGGRGGAAQRPSQRPLLPVLAGRAGAAARRGRRRATW